MVQGPVAGTQFPATSSGEGAADVLLGEPHRGRDRLAQRQPVTAVALDLGYDSPSAFIHAFRRALGKTPRSYFGPVDMEIGAAKS